MPRTKFNVLAQYLQQIMEESLPKMINDAITNHIPSQVDSSVRNYMLGHILHVHPTQATPTSAQEQQHQLYLTMRDNPQLQQDDLPIWLALKYKFEKLHVATTPCRPSAVHPRDQDDPHDDAHPDGENSAKRQKTSEHGTFMFGESSYGQDFESDQGPLTLGNQEELDDFDFWTDSYATEDDEIPYKKESRKEIIVTPHPQRPAPVVQSCQRDPKALALSLVNQDLLYLKKGSSRPEKIMMSLHKFPVFIFPDDDIEERTSRWLGVESYQQKVNLTAPTITFLGIEKFKVFSIVSEPRVFEGLKSYNNDVKHGYVSQSLSNEDVEYLQLFEEEIKEWLKRRDQMTR
ncbi:hypothetical protein Tco_0261172 [Tanacetum coccineum]